MSDAAALPVPPGPSTPAPEGRIAVHDRLAPDDISGVTDLVQASTEADGTPPLSEHVRLHLRHGGDGPDRHLLLTAPGGDAIEPEIVGYAHLDPTDVVAGPSAELVVHPGHRGRGYGRALVAAVMAQARETSGDGAGRLRLWAHGDHPAARALAASMGFEEVRRLLQLRRPLDDPLCAIRLPPGVRLRSFRPGDDDDAWLDVNARAFADHPEQGRWTAADLHARMAEPWFDADGFLLAERDGAIVGFHWTKVHGELAMPSHATDDPAAGADPGTGEPSTPRAGHGHEAIGEVYVLGVHPDHRGAGLGQVLTIAGLEWLRARGLDQAMLYVEADNAAALRVYEGLGFTVWDTDVMFRRSAAPIG